MSRKPTDRPVGRLMLADDDVSLESLFGHLRHVAVNIGPGESLTEFMARRDGIIEDEIHALVRILNGNFDAFDVLELLRQRETPVTLTGYREVQSDGIASVIELVALILIARGSRKPPSNGDGDQLPNQIVDELHRRCSVILMMTAATVSLDRKAETQDPLATLSAQYCGHELIVRTKQYVHLRDEINQALFGCKEVEPLIKDILGFTYTEGYSESV